MDALEAYLREMEASSLLSLLYNGYRYINDQPALENVTLEEALSNEGFCKFTADNLNDEYIKGI